MINHDSNSRPLNNGLITPPAYPFSGLEFLTKMRVLLSQQHKHSLGFEELGLLIGKAKSSADYWFSHSSHRHLEAFVGLLEHLPPAQRRTFIDSHCRVLPTLADPRFLASQTAKVLELLDRKTGLTIVTGATESVARFS